MTADLGAVIAETASAFIHEVLWDVEPCRSACTHVVKGDWTALGLANVYSRRLAERLGGLVDAATRSERALLDMDHECVGHHDSQWIHAGVTRVARMLHDVSARRVTTIRVYWLAPLCWLRSHTWKLSAVLHAAWTPSTWYCTRCEVTRPGGRMERVENEMWWVTLDAHGNELSR